MPKEVYGRDHPFLEWRELPPSIDRPASRGSFAFMAKVQKIRITGGEPLVRRDLETPLIAQLAELGVDLTLTTNGPSAAPIGSWLSCSPMPGGSHHQPPPR